MANHKSSAAQAIKDMLELGIDVTFFTGHITELHMLNINVGIITKDRIKRVKKEPKKEPKPKPKKIYAPKAIPTPKHVYNQRIIINVDGTVSIEYNEWDYE